MRRQVILQADSPIARDVTRATAMFLAGDVEQADAAYAAATTNTAALKDADQQPGLWAALAMQHVAHLLDLAAPSRALRRCDVYLAAVPSSVPPLSEADRIELQLLRAEVLSAGDAHSRAAAEAAAVRRRAEAAPLGFDVLDEARLLRVEGLAAADTGDLPHAVGLLLAARDRYRAADSADGVAAADRALRLAALRTGSDTEGGPPQAPDAAPRQGAGRTVADRLAEAGQLRAQAKYEQALTLLSDIRLEAIDPALRFAVLQTHADLLRLIRRPEEADALAADLATAATATLDPAGSRLRLAIGSQLPSAAASASSSLVDQFRAAAALIAAARQARRDDFDTAEQALAQAREQVIALYARAVGARDRAIWHLIAGELARGQWETSHDLTRLHAAVTELSRAVDLAADTSSVQTRQRALRALGHVQVELADRQGQARRADGLASPETLRLWQQARHLEEWVADQQDTDKVRLRMLADTSTEFDEQIRAAQAGETDAAAALNAADPRAARTGTVRSPSAAAGAACAGSELAARSAGVIRAMDAGRASTFLTLLQAHEPEPSSAERWLKRITRDLPRSQLVWIVHAGPQVLHHALLGRGFARHFTLTVERAALDAAVRVVLAYTADPEVSSRSPDFERSLRRLAQLLGLPEVQARIPGQVERLAVVAGGVLADVPFAALPSGHPVSPAADPVRLGQRYAVSDLPCLAARRPLHHRARRRRGSRILVVRPPTDLPSSRHPQVAGRRVHLLIGQQATLEGLRAALSRFHPNVVRIDTHAGVDPANPDRAWLQLAPAGPHGRITPADLRGLDLSRCGTLVLGACETGMGEPLGRDERDGFVRAAFDAGAACVLAARWQSHHQTADDVLDTFVGLLSRQPRDVALRRALRQVEAEHPAQWACWALYGDAGCQTRAAAVRQWWRRWRVRAATKETE